MIIMEKDTGGNATGSKTVALGTNNKDKLMSQQMLTSNDRKKTHTNETKPKKIIWR